MKILILGATGMLGSMVLEYLSTKKELEITATLRRDQDKYKQKYPNVNFVLMKSLDDVNFDNHNLIINCIGLIRQKLNDPKEAILVNALMPHILSEKAPRTGTIQIATDCVFSGKKGLYIEEDGHDATDVYGKTKSLGEVGRFLNIRTSIIGPDRNGNASLLEWFMSQEKGATVQGYANHFWNGITTLHFAKLCYGLIVRKRRLPNNTHFIPMGMVNKYTLLKIFSEKFDRKDVNIEEYKTEIAIDKSLKTNNRDQNYALWNDMGYKVPLTIEQMVEELADYIKDRDYYGI